MDAAAVVGAIGLQPREAIGHLAAKGVAVTGPWTDWLAGEHARASTVANVAKLDVVSDIHDSLQAALQGGQTLQQWQADLVPTLQRKGWWQASAAGPGDMSTEQLRQAGRLDAATGEIRKGLTPHRLKTIYQTNMQSAYMAGRYNEMMATADERPAWQYVAVLDSKTRPAHRAMNGRVFHYTDKGWRVFWPPCGYGCRCRVRSLSLRDLKRKGLQMDSTEGKLSEVQVPLANGRTATVTRYSDPSLRGAGNDRAWFQPDPGFSNNAAQSVWMPKLAGKPVELVRPFVRDVVNGPQFERFVSAGGDLAGSMPVGVLSESTVAALGPAASQAVRDAAVYLTDDVLAAGVGRDVGIERWRLLPDLIAFGRRTDAADDALRLALDEDAGELTGVLRLVNGEWRLTGITWSPRGARP